MKYIFSFLVLFIVTISTFSFGANCQFSGGDFKQEFKNCNPATGILTKSDINLDVQKTGSDFRTTIAEVVRRVQIVTSIIAIGVIVWIGLIMVLPVSAEAKESAKTKIFSVLLGFLFMISATIIVNAIINLLYEILK